jgi:hypothetical protein
VSSRWSVIVCVTVTVSWLLVIQLDRGCAVVDEHNVCLFSFRQELQRVNDATIAWKLKIVPARGGPTSNWEIMFGSG